MRTRTTLDWPRVKRWAIVLIPTCLAAVVLNRATGINQNAILAVAFGSLAIVDYVLKRTGNGRIV